eukprot:6465543-Amphidinium_carterae.1
MQWPAQALLGVARDSIPLSPSHCLTVALNPLGKPLLGDPANGRGLPASPGSSHDPSTATWKVFACAMLPSSQGLLVALGS